MHWWFASQNLSFGKVFFQLACRIILGQTPRRMRQQLSYYLPTPVNCQNWISIGLLIDWLNWAINWLNIFLFDWPLGYLFLSMLNSLITIVLCSVLKAFRSIEGYHGMTLDTTLVLYSPIARNIFSEKKDPQNMFEAWSWINFQYPIYFQYHGSPHNSCSSHQYIWHDILRLDRY